MNEPSVANESTGGSIRPTTDADIDERLSMPLAEAMMSQRAVRRVLPDPVDDAVILRCIELSLKAPTGSNGQNWEFVIVRDTATKAVLARRYRQAWAPYEKVGQTLLERRRAEQPDQMASMKKIIRAVRWQVDNFESIPVLVIPCLKGGKAPVLPQPSLSATSFYGSIYPSVQNLLLAARAIGLGASLITMPLWNLATARRVLGLPMNVTPACVVPLGWPRGRYGPTTRRPVGDVVHLERFGNRPWHGQRFADQRAT